MGFVQTPYGLAASDLDAVLQRSPSAWDSLRGARLFIGGGTGFFGKWLVASIAWANAVLDTGIEATVLTRDADSFLRHRPGDDRIRPWPGDVRTFAFPPDRFTHVIQAATPNSLPSVLDAVEVIVGGTRRVLDLARQCGARVLFTSSGAVYGPQPPQLAGFAEDYPGAPDPLVPHSVYGQAKRMAEQLCSVYGAEGVESVVARCFSFVGPHLPLDKHFAIGNFIRDALEGEAVVVNGNAGAVRSYLYTADLVSWLVAVLTAGEAGAAYNVGSDQPVTIGQLAARTRDLLAPHKPVRLPETAGAFNSYVPDIGKARTQLGLEVWTSLDEAILRTAEFHRSGTSAGRG